MKKLIIGTAVSAVILAIGACATGPGHKDAAAPESGVEQSEGAPMAKKVERITEIHGEELVDYYFWLRDKEDPDTIAYLEAENRYTEAMMAHTEGLQEELFEEILSRIEETDLSVPVRHGDYYYYSRTVEGQNYEIHCRRKGSMDAPEEILLDENLLAEGLEYFSLGVFELSDDHRWLAYSIDPTGNERYTLRFRDLESGEDLGDEILNTSGAAWGKDGETVFYTTLDAAHRPDKVFRHRLGSQEEDRLVYHEEDDGFYAYVGRSRSGRFLFLTLWSNSQGEWRYLDLEESGVEGEFQVLSPRQPGVEYRVEHQGDHFYIVTNEDAVNFRLMRAPLEDPRRDQWEEVIAHREEVQIRNVQAFRDWMVIEEREGGLPGLRIRQMESGAEHHVEFPEEVYALGRGENPEYHGESFRLTYSSLVTPRSVFDYHLGGRELELMKETVVHHYDRSRYETHRVMATAPDGREVPISLVHQAGIELDGSHPMLLVGYGSYGMSYDPFFSSVRVALLERGVIFGIAHVRGGGEMGRPWYEDGKLEQKTNTFTDFIAAVEHLIEAGYTSPQRLAINGGSAGGLLMGAVINMRPELFQAVVADVPFVDVINTMLDATLPLTVLEYNEWGNPNEEEFFHLIRSYSPYDNVREQPYPHMLVTAGLNDPRVHYWEPAKWVAKLRTHKTDENLLLLKTNMGAGHGGASGRYDWFREIALTYAFILDRLGVVED